MYKTTRPDAGAAPLNRRTWMGTVLALLSACGGGGGVDSGGTGTGAQATLAVGTISGFGSIVVNGVHYDETDARVSDDDGGSRARDDLRLGMRASVLATLPDAGMAKASEVTIRSELGGPIDSVDLVAGRLVVLGQRVDLNSATVVEGGTASLAAGADVAVYGTLDVAGRRIVATRIEPRSGATFLKIRGIVDTLDTVAGTLAIGSLVVDWRNVAPAQPATALAPGQAVYLRLAPSPASGTRVAVALQVESALLADRDNAELEGRITVFTSATSFELDGVPVDASNASFPDGQAGLAAGARVEVSGPISGGLLRARQVTIESEEGDSAEPYELSGKIVSVDTPGRSFVVRGITVHWDDATRFRQGQAADLAAGVKVELRGALDASGVSLLATSIQFDD